MSNGNRGTLSRAFLALGLPLLLALPAVAGQKVRVGHSCDRADRPSLAEVDHTPFDALLQKYVDNHGLVAYARWKASANDLHALDEYLARAGCVDLEKPSPKPARLAYWINLYNALTLRGILREYPTDSIRNHTSRFGGYNIWKDLLVSVDNRPLSLDDIEHAILRKMGEPRIHLAVVCASKGCPPLRNQAYLASNLDEQLNANGRRFFARPENLQIDATSRTVSLSQLFQWYGNDFGAAPAEQIQALRPLFPASEALAWTARPDVRVRYLNYDWALNDQAPAR
ncbi:MAG: DUF547 domain-containing protein [Isosphaeraceae bacterium]